MKVGGANFWSIFSFQKSVILQAKIDLKKKKKKKKKKTGISSGLCVRVLPGFVTLDLVRHSKLPVTLKRFDARCSEPWNSSIRPSRARFGCWLGHARFWCCGRRIDEWKSGFSDRAKPDLGVAIAFFTGPGQILVLQSPDFGCGNRFLIWPKSGGCSTKISLGHINKAISTPKSGCGLSEKPDFPTQNPAGAAPKSGWAPIKKGVGNTQNPAIAASKSGWALSAGDFHTQNPAISPPKSGWALSKRPSKSHCR